MGRGTKTCLGCGIVLVLACCVLSAVTLFALPLVVSNLTAGLGGSADPVKARQVGAQIADYTLPADHSEQAGVDAAVMQMVIIAPKTFSETEEFGDGYVIMLMTIKLPVDSAQLEQQMRSALLEQTKANGSTFQKVGERKVTIRGQATTLTILEDAPTNGTVRMVTGSFQGKGGQTLLMMLGNISTWDWDKVEKFLQSIR